MHQLSNDDKRLVVRALECYRNTTKEHARVVGVFSLTRAALRESDRAAILRDMIAAAPSISIDGGDRAETPKSRPSN